MEEHNHAGSELKQTEQLIATLQQTNKALRSRAIILGVFLLIALGFAIKNHDQKYVAHDLEYGLYSISALAQLSPDSMREDLKQNQETYNSELSPYIDWAGVRLQLKESGYKDKTPLFKAHEDLSALQRRMREGNGYDNINILGLSMPALPWIFLGGLIVLLLFHDFTMMMFHRRKIAEKLEGKVDEVLYGPEMFVSNFSYLPRGLVGYVRFLSSGIIFMFLTIPLITVLFFFWASTQIHLRGFVDIAILINLFCTIVVFTDFVLLLYYENAIGVKTISKYVLRMSELKGLRWYAKLFRLSILLVIPLIPILLHSVFWLYWEPYEWFNIWWSCSIYLQCGTLILGLLIRSASKFVVFISDMCIVTGLGMLLFWILYGVGMFLHLVNTGTDVTSILPVSYGIMLFCLAASVLVAAIRRRIS